MADEVEKLQQAKDRLSQEYGYLRDERDQLKASSLGMLNLFALTAEQIGHTGTPECRHCVLLEQVAELAAPLYLYLNINRSDGSDEDVTALRLIDPERFALLCRLTSRGARLGLYHDWSPFTQE